MRELDAFKILPRYIGGRYHHLLFKNRTAATETALDICAEFELDDGSYLLLLRNGAPYSDELALAYLAPDFTLRAHLPLPAGTLSEVRPVASRRLSFRFGDAHRTVDVGSCSARRPFGRRWLQVH